MAATGKPVPEHLAAELLKQSVAGYGDDILIVDAGEASKILGGNFTDYKAYQSCSGDSGMIIFDRQQMLRDAGWIDPPAQVNAVSGQGRIGVEAGKIYKS